MERPPVWAEEMPEAKEPAPEPPVTGPLPKAPWNTAGVAGTPEDPALNHEGIASAGGHVKVTLCPSCNHLQQDGSCSGPPPEEKRADPSFVACNGYQDKYGRRLKRF